MYHLYVDETGHTSAAASNRHTQRHLNLTGVIIPDASLSVFEDNFNRVREEHFDHAPWQPIVLHRAQMNGGRGIYASLKDPFLRDSFESDFCDFLSENDYSVISVTLDKIAFYYRHEKWIGEPYEFCAFNMIERFCLFLIHKGATGTLTVETRDPKVDELFKAAFAEFCQKGTRYIDAGKADRLLGRSPVSIAKKNDDVIGCQVADFLCQPLLEASLKRYRNQGDPSAWHKRIVQAAWPKLYRGKHNKLDGCGLVWRPK